MDEKELAQLIVDRARYLLAQARVGLDDLKRAHGLFACIKAAASVLPEANSDIS